MEHKRREVLQSLNNVFKDLEQSIKDLEEQLQRVQLERDMYKDMLSQVQNTNDLIHVSRVAYMSVYTMDNSEGMDTETCIGVFTTRALAMQAILDVCRQNKELNVNSFSVEEFSVDEPLVPHATVQVVQYDEETHCAVSTSILGIKCKALQDKNFPNCYLAEYIVNRVYPIEK
jgi:hypothetical protein